LPFSGYCNNYFKDGKLEATCYFENGIILSSKSWDKSGLLLDSTIFLDNESKILLFSFYKNGKIEDQGTFTLKKNYLKTFFHGKIDYYAINGHYISYFKNGNKSFEGDFVNDIKNGTFKYYNKKGLIVAERVYQNDKLINPVYEWDTNRNKFEVIYFLNKKGDATIEESRKLIENE
jgi:antitoxin component YwqK of YwqJK toxin-antitoxin module